MTDADERRVQSASDGEPILPHSCHVREDVRHLAIEKPHAGSNDRSGYVHLEAFLTNGGENESETLTAAFSRLG